MVAYGYRVGEVPLPIPEEIKEGVEITPTREVPLSIRPPAQISLGCHSVGVACPHPDMSHPPTAAAGVRKRFARRPPDPVKRRPENGDRLNLADFSDFVRKFVREHFKPLSPDSDTSVDAWLEKCPYPAWRKSELREKWHAMNGKLTERHFRVKSFVKDETYLEYKHARGINSRTDEFKCAVGPIFRLIEEEVYKLDYFIKKIPVNKRPMYISKLLDRIGALVVETDYTAFETHFTDEFFEACEFILYDHMTRYLPEHEEFMGLMRDVIAGWNHCVFKHFFVNIRATRMSGEMNTSLGNGFANLMLMLYVCQTVGFTDVRCVVEGDDCLATGFGVPPSSEDFRKLGFNIKLAVRDSIAESSFCGLMFDPKELINVSDPVEALASFGWAMSAYVRSSHRRRMALLRCKSLSYAHQYPGCPVISSLAQYGLRVTRGYDVRSFVENERSISMWDREQYRSAAAEGRIPAREPGLLTRMLVERQFGISIDTQRRVESYLDGLSALMPLDPPGIRFPDVWHKYYDSYAHPEPWVSDLMGPLWVWPQPFPTGPIWAARRGRHRRA